jgi:hypothetical protein
VRHFARKGRSHHLDTLRRKVGRTTAQAATIRVAVPSAAYSENAASDDSVHPISPQRDKMTIRWDRSEANPSRIGPSLDR